MAHICPIEGKQINEPAVRVVAILVAITALTGILFQSPFIFFFLAYDFFVRGFDRKQWSLFRLIAVKAVSIFEFKPKLIDAGGKKFAARIGFIFSVILTISALLVWPVVVVVFGGVIVLFASLESAIAFCVGCRLHSLFLKISSEPAASDDIIS
jgi:hypothetical protein